MIWLHTTGLTPSDNFEIAHCDMIVDMMADLLARMMKFFFEKDEERKVIKKQQCYLTQEYIHISVFLIDKMEASCLFWLKKNVFLVLDESTDIQTFL